jgi:ABC-type spermidine/putrescine transport system permease subunit II
MKRTITEQKLFQMLSLGPVIVPMTATAIGFGLRSLGESSGVVEGAALTIAFAGAYSAVPYLVFLVVVYGVIQPWTRPR